MHNEKQAGRDLTKLKQAMQILSQGGVLPFEYCDGPLVSGQGSHTCVVGIGLHLIYKVDVEMGWVVFARLGSSSIFE
ncbi:TPA: hypothetical protein ACGBH7_000960 [Pseudomonas aeruginosa]|uniref:hypothetical protein n=1 Tax=Pseudomonas aeruginosa TaxID=287 RepID=UPI0036D5CACF